MSRNLTRFQCPEKGCSHKSVFWDSKCCITYQFKQQFLWPRSSKFINITTPSSRCCEIGHQSQYSDWGAVRVALSGLLSGYRKAPGFGLSSPPPLCRHRTHQMPQGGRRVWTNKCSSSSSHFGVFDIKGPPQGQSWEMAKKTDDLYAHHIPLRGPFNPIK